MPVDKALPNELTVRELLNAMREQRSNQEPERDEAVAGAADTEEASSVETTLKAAAAGSRADADPEFK